MQEAILVVLLVTLIVEQVELANAGLLPVTQTA
jgi:hypothetical protein